ncbi:hypothetical protein GCM10027514_07240 [Azotobacter armeniacus]
MSIETIRIDGIATPVSRIGLGTWAIGGWMWGGIDDERSVETIREIENSLRRLRTDLYQTHWPDPLEPHEETARKLEKLREEGKSLAIGVSSYWMLEAEYLRQFGAVLAEHGKDPAGPGFIAPPARQD